MELNELLRKSGFSDKETAVYLALMAMGPSVVSDIAERAGINRTTAYIILETLMKRELVNTDDTHGVKLFTPNEPEDLAKYLERASKHFAQLSTQARKLVPSLKKIAKTKTPNTEDSAFGAALSSLEKIRAEAPAKQPQSSPKTVKGKLAHGTT
jgi:sugar-specific transcriptional regulator TrmB